MSHTTTGSDATNPAPTLWVGWIMFGSVMMMMLGACSTWSRGSSP